jgi:hypothetical protein
MAFRKDPGIGHPRPDDQARAANLAPKGGVGKAGRALGESIKLHASSWVLSLKVKNINFANY